MFIESFAKLKQYIEGEKYIGYDPYDTLNSFIPFSALGKFPAAVAIQAQKRNPINIRPLLGIKKDVNPKAFGLFLHTYSILYKNTQNPNYKEQADYFFNWLTNNYTKNYSGICWGYNFDWASPEKILKTYSPTVVVSGFIAKGIFEYYLSTKNIEAVKTLESIAKFVWNDLEKTTFDSGICISYSTVKKDCCYNASMLAAEIFSMLYYITQQPDYKSRSLEISSFVIEQQHNDGHWNYSLNANTGKERMQIDFHQGYILDSLYLVQKNLSISNDSFDSAIKKGLKYYIEKQFLPNGKSLWRIPKKWPVDIHNQSQGIITLCRLNDYNSQSLTFAKKITQWTIQNMQHSSGYFYYRNYPLYKIKIPYMRWSQAWMLLALTELLNSENEN